jgi:predicted RecA/RadA family phage recombinase
LRITIDNLDGLGAVDYTGAVAAEGRLRVERKLNAPSRCVADIVEGVGGVTLPVRHGRVVVTAEDDSSTVLFTGYVTTEPVRVYAGVGSEGNVYRARVTAVSDEWLLDKQGSGAPATGGLTLALDGRSLLQRLTSRAQNGGGGIGVASGGATARAVGTFFARGAAPWSVNAGDAASAAYAGYRAVAGQVLLQPAGTVTHMLSDADGTLDVHALQVGAVRELANDVTLSGAEEPTAYVSEVFMGDGTTTLFTLTEPAFRGTARTLIDDRFEEAPFDATVWAASDPGSHLSLTSAGLTISGGTGFDGQTMLTALDGVEMGGTIVVELGSVVLGAASDGMLGGMYAGPSTLTDCFAGFRVRQSSGVTTLVPVLNGAEVGSAYTPAAGHKYTLRLRLHCVEQYRVMQRYYTMVDGAVETFGSAGAVDAPMDVVFELVDEGVASSTPATVLYDTAAGVEVTGTPAVCAFVAVNSTQINGSVGSVRVTRPGSVWVVSTLPSGIEQTRLMGVAGEGVDCVLQYGVASKLTFLAGRIPVPGERLTVQYRQQQRSVARLADAASVAAEALGGGAGTSRWVGKVLQPVARTSVDCESAAEALLAFATSRTAAVAGTYVAVNPEDIWPGDLLNVTSEGVTSALLVRSVAIEDGGAVPEVRRYRVVFANDWATEWEDGLGLRLSEQIAADALLPQSPLSAPGVVLENLQELAITSLTMTVLGLDVGIPAPVGGGFEVRRRDQAFGASGSDLVLRSPVRNFSISRAAQVERYFVRAYDGSVPPVYSRFSSAVLVNWPA